jgi:hypothetical protein
LSLFTILRPFFGKGKGFHRPSFQEVFQLASQSALKMDWSLARNKGITPLTFPCFLPIFSNNPRTGNQGGALEPKRVFPLRKISASLVQIEKTKKAAAARIRVASACCLLHTDGGLLLRRGTVRGPDKE